MLSSSENLGQLILCTKCGKPGEFRKRHRQCRACLYKANQEYRRTHPPTEEQQAKHRRQVVESGRRRKARLRLKYDELKKKPCVDCGGTFPVYVMDFDHRDPATKTLEVSRLLNYGSMPPWARIQVEIEKCDLVCACCHRLRSWKPQTDPDARRRLLIALKDKPCADCKRTFHYSQMDFDHVRGNKRGCVSSLGPKEEILEEAKKCDVVCANCHRTRTYSNGTSRLDPAKISPARAPVPYEPYHKRSVPPEPRFWHVLAGTMPDTEVAKVGGVSKSMVALYRKRVGIPAFGTVDHLCPV